MENEDRRSPIPDEGPVSAETQALETAEPDLETLPAAPECVPAPEDSRYAQRQLDFEIASWRAAAGPSIDADGPFGNSYRVQASPNANKQLLEAFAGSREVFIGFAAVLAELTAAPARFEPVRAESVVRLASFFAAGRTWWVPFVIDEAERLVTVIRVDDAIRIRS